MLWEREYFPLTVSSFHPGFGIGLTSTMPSGMRTRMAVVGLRAHPCGTRITALYEAPTGASRRSSVMCAPAHETAATATAAPIKSLPNMDRLPGFDIILLRIEAKPRAVSGPTMANRESAFIEITPEVLLKAYACGIFPMAESADDPALYWIEPEMRGIIPLDR